MYALYVLTVFSEYQWKANMLFLNVQNISGFFFFGHQIWCPNKSPQDNSRLKWIEMNTHLP